MLCEIAARCGLDAVEAVAKVDLVQIQLENLVFREMPFELHREQHFFELAAQRFLAADTLSRKLLGDGATALNRFARLNDGERGTGDTNQVEPVVVVEPLVLDSHHGVDQGRRHVRERNLDAVFFRDGKNFLVLGVKQDGGAWHPAKGAELVFTRDTRNEIDEKPDKGGKKERRTAGKRPLPQRTRPPREGDHHDLWCNGCTTSR